MSNTRGHWLTRLAAGGGHGRGGEEDAGGDPGDVRQVGGRGQEDRLRGLLTPDQSGLVLRVLICPTPAQSIMNLKILNIIYIVIYQSS